MATAGARLLAVRVQPGASRAEIVGWQGDELRVRVTAPPDGGRANDAVVALLAERLRVPASSIALVRGARGRAKHFRIGALGPAEVRARLQEGAR
jgi:uncharacterized protein (TIGR00251 family)